MMTVDPIHLKTPLANNDARNGNGTVTPEQAAAFAATLDATTESTSDDRNVSQDTRDSSIPTTSWDVFYQGFNHSIFDHTRRELAYYDHKRKEVYTSHE